MARAYVGIRAEAGDRRSALDVGLLAIAGLGEITVGSPIYDSAVPGATVTDGGLGAVVGVETDLDPMALVEHLRAAEADYGGTAGSEESIDPLAFDVLWYNGEHIATPDLTVPHPRIRQRRSVLAPLVEAVPGLSDDDGPYAAALPDVDDQPLRKISGPVDRARKRWRSGLLEALSLESEESFYTFHLNPDWENRSHSMFGGFLCAAALVAGGAEYPEMFPASVTYRFFKPLPAGGRASIHVRQDRRSDRSAHMTISLSKRGVEYGRAHLSVVSDPGGLVAGVAMPGVLPIHECIPLDVLVAETGDEPGNSIRSWRPFERWDIPDLVDGSTDLLRAWCPNPCAGSNDPYLSAASLLMPIDALIWPTTMLVAGRLGSTPAMFTPTMELSARFPDTEDIGFWHVAEAQVDHLTTKSVSGTVKAWSEDGRHCATGHSLNRAIG